MVGRMIELDPVIEEDANLPLPVPLNYVSDISKAQDELGWNPQIGIEEGLRTLL
jgi:nucleoside-diphosphate-sugar epimerase